MCATWKQGIMGALQLGTLVRTVFSHQSRGKALEKVKMRVNVSEDKCDHIDNAILGRHMTQELVWTLEGPVVTARSCPDLSRVSRSFLLSDFWYQGLSGCGSSLTIYWLN